MSRPGFAPEIPFDRPQYQEGRNRKYHRPDHQICSSKYRSSKTNRCLIKKWHGTDGASEKILTLTTTCPFEQVSLLL
jgi:hypothetical protein